MQVEDRERYACWIRTSGRVDGADPAGDVLVAHPDGPRQLGDQPLVSQYDECAAPSTCDADFGCGSAPMPAQGHP
ncbi:hypothetical protein [Micromonospora fulviviridis]|uniref:hypothetical protein n=1 Tax=Micromonospora fulviviridis TaxID=47860 RepID=UPI00378A7CDA